MGSCLANLINLWLITECVQSAVIYFSEILASKSLCLSLRKLIISNCETLLYFGRSNGHRLDGGVTSAAPVGRWCSFNPGGLVMRRAAAEPSHALQGPMQHHRPSWTRISDKPVSVRGTAARDRRRQKCTGMLPRSPPAGTGPTPPFPSTGSVSRGLHGVGVHHVAVPPWATPSS